MHKFILGVLLLPALAYAQPVTVEKTVVCDTPKTVIESLTGTHQEKPFWTGTDEKSRYIMLVNEETGTWTMLQFNNKIACIIGTGINHKQVFSGPKV